MKTRTIKAGALIPGDTIVVERVGRKETEKVRSVSGHDWTRIEVQTRTGDALATMVLADSDLVEVLDR